MDPEDPARPPGSPGPRSETTGEMNCHGEEAKPSFPPGLRCPWVPHCPPILRNICSPPSQHIVSHLLVCPGPGATRTLPFPPLLLCLSLCPSPQAPLAHYPLALQPPCPTLKAQAAGPELVSKPVNLGRNARRACRPATHPGFRTSHLSKSGGLGGGSERCPTTGAPSLSVAKLESLPRPLCPVLEGQPTLTA